MDLLGLLTEGELSVSGRLVVASNMTLLGEVAHEERRVRCVYKPISGERPLWDFPDGTLAAREVAAYHVSEAAGWHVVPPTVLRDDGPLGPGMCQLWLEQPDPETTSGARSGRATPWVDVVGEGEVPHGWLPILSAFGEDGRPVVLVHADEPGLRRLALFDAVVNNADRKGGHVLHGDPDMVGNMSAIVGVDHGVSFHDEPKLRTVLWGWAGQPLTAAERAELVRLQETLGGTLTMQLAELLDPAEIDALHERISTLLQDGALPEPAGRMPVPWPVF
ncbi:SCO1664 family protein [Phytoactinopolyspora halotolerans]|uniref:SCO1664 family protein n=1 Tax=Phytoactinopolyspora halotolerans TaxID=1981512 RepID=A0A6L9S9B3_9ACTN|nr:SCO1664 family protein [Phytoactinopolyspora halotolerans]NEE01301.1 SCO1664 family protein [Phytoactinopolyspora halotolerans]